MGVTAVAYSKTVALEKRSEVSGTRDFSLLRERQ